MCACVCACVRVCANAAVLYKRGPPFYHASYSVIVKPVHTDLSSSTLSHSWTSLAALNRITQQVGKVINLSSFYHQHYYYYYYDNHLTAAFSGLPGWAGTRKVKPIWILLKQETVSGSGISWAICKSAPHSRQITMPATHHSVFYRPDALPAAQPTASKH